VVGCVPDGAGLFRRADQSVALQPSHLYRLLFPIRSVRRGHHGLSLRRRWNVVLGLSGRARLHPGRVRGPCASQPL